MLKSFLLIVAVLTSSSLAYAGSFHGGHEFHGSGGFHGGVGSLHQGNDHYTIPPECSYDVYGGNSCN